MTTLTKDLLLQYGFTENTKIAFDDRTVMTKDRFDVVIMDDGSFYHSVGAVDTPLNNVDDLKELYKKMRGEDLG